jgi:hypothetical protein
MPKFGLCFDECTFSEFARCRNMHNLHKQSLRHRLGGAGIRFRCGVVLHRCYPNALTLPRQGYRNGAMCRLVLDPVWHDLPRGLEDTTLRRPVSFSNGSPDAEWT